MKILTLIFWLIFAIAFAGLIPNAYAYWVKIIGLFLLLAHAMEFVLFNKVIKAKGDGTFRSFAMTMIFGVFYFKF